MKITSLSRQQRSQNRVNVFIDGKYKLSLDESQLVELKIVVGLEFDDELLLKLEQESIFGKIYLKTLDYCLLRPRSKKEIQQYFVRRKIDPSIADRVMTKLISKGYQDDRSFVRYWVNNRMIKKGVSQKRLIYELKQKGISEQYIRSEIEESERSDNDEIDKVILKKKSRYSSDKLMQYLIRQGFNYYLVREKVSQLENSDISV